MPQTQQENSLTKETVMPRPLQGHSSHEQTSQKESRRGGALRRFLSKVKGLIARLWPHVCLVVGIPLIYIGVVLMMVFYFTNLTNYNILLFLPLLLIAVGIIGKVAADR